MPLSKQVGNLNENFAKGWQMAGYDGHKLLSIIKAQNIKELPKILWAEGQRLQIIEVPMTRQLTEGTEYTFKFRPQTGIDWAIVNGDKWYKEWKKEDGVYTITIKPRVSGALGLYVNLQGNVFKSVLEYNVVR